MHVDLNIGRVRIFKRAAVSEGVESESGNAVMYHRPGATLKALGNIV